MKLFNKYNRLNLTMMVAVFLLSSIVYYLLLNHILIHELDEDLMEKRQKIEAYAGKHTTLPVFEDLDDIQVLYAASSSSAKESALTFIGRYDPEESKVRGFRQLTYTQALAGKYYKVSIIKPVEGTQALLRTIVGTTISTILLIIALSLLFNRIILRKLWKPFYDTVAAMRLFTLSKKQLPAFPETDIDEFIFLKDNLSATITRAQQEYQSLKEFTENASHELQTPLSIIRSKLDLIIQEEDVSEKQSELLKQAYSAIKKLSRLSQSLLLLTKIENNQFTVVSPVNLKEKIEEKVQQFQELWHNNNITVATRLEQGIVQMNPELMDILLNNLLNNATRHNLHGGSLCITLLPNRLSVENTGQQKPLDATRLFRRFYKAEQHTQSNGLGLSIIKEICSQAGITVKYAFVEHRHVFSLIFP